MINLSFLPELDVESLKNLNLIVGCFFFAFTGSYMQEILNIYRGFQRATRIYKVVIGTIIGMGVYLLLSLHLLKNISIPVMIAINVLTGALGYEVFNQCSSIDNIKKLSADINEIFRNLTGIGDFLSRLFGNNNDKKDDNHK